jgi:hypothetical protein
MGFGDDHGQNVTSTCEIISRMAVDLISSIQILQKAKRDWKDDPNLRKRLELWSGQWKETTTRFFRDLYENAEYGFNKQGLELPDWFKSVIDKIAEVKFEGGNKATLPFIREEVFHQDGKENSDSEGMNKLLTLLKMKFSSNPESFTQTEQLLSESNGHLLTDAKARKQNFMIRNISHLVDDTDTNDIEILVDDLTEKNTFDREITDATHLLLLLHVIHSTKKSDEIDLLEKYSESKKEFLTMRSANGTTNTQMEILNRMEFLKWGPSNFTRDQNVIDQASNLLNANGVVALRGWGGVGKTALATRMIYDAAINSNFERYITSGTKVGNLSQDEYNIHHDEEGQFIPADQTTTIFQTILDRSGGIEGSIRRVCMQIIRSAAGNVKSESFGDKSNEQMITLAIDSMKKCKMLVCIDNFEDIEDAKDISRKGVAIEKLLEESKHFNTFFARWTQSYLEMKKKSPNLVQSQIIITTRSMGKGAVPYDVPYLTEKENYDLFLQKIQTRVRNKNLDESIIAYVDGELRQEVRKEFAEWRILDTNDDDEDILIEGTHPMNTLSAANEISKSRVLETIRDWSPKGEKAEHIAQYIASKALGNASPLNKNILVKLALINIRQTFSAVEVILIAKDYKDNFGYEEAFQFLKMYESERDWFQKSPNQKDRYRWKREIYLNIGKIEDVIEAKLEVQKIQIETTEAGMSKASKVTVFDEKNRNQLYQWMADKDRIPHQIGSILLQILTEENLSDRQSCSAYLALFDVNRQREQHFHKSYQIDKSLTQVLLEFHRNRKKQSMTSFSNSSKTKGISDTVQTPEGLAIQRHLEKYLKYSDLVFDELWLKCQDTNIKMALVDAISRNFERLYLEEFITTEQLLKIEQKWVEKICSISNSEIMDDEKHSLLLQTAIKSMATKMEIIPNKINYSFKLNSIRIEQCIALLKADDAIFSWGLGGNEETRGRLFWIALHYLANSNGDDDDSKRAQNVIEKYTFYGRKMVEEFLHPNLIERYITTITNNRKRLVWNLEELTGEGNRFGLIGKIVTSPKDRIRNGMNVSDYEIIYPKGMDSKRYDSKSILFYRIMNYSGSIIYLTPLLDEEFRPLELEEIISLTDLKKQLNTMPRITKPTTWNELFETINSITELFLDPLFRHCETDREKVSYLGEITDLKLFTHEEQGKIYIKQSDFTDKERSGLASYAYEEKFSTDKAYLQIIQSARDGDGYSLPRNPRTLALLLIFFKKCSLQKKSMTYNGLRVYLRKQLGESDPDILYRTVQYFFNSRKDRLRERNWNTLDIDYDQHGTADEIFKSFKNQLYFQGFVRRNKENKQPLNLEIYQMYLTEVRKIFRELNNK